MPRIPLVDWFVIAWFVTCWAGYTYFAQRKSSEIPSLVVSMRIYRREWFKHVLGRDNRIADIAALNSLLTGATFFASTSLLILGGLAAMLGTTERVIDLAADLPFARHESGLVWLGKIILLIVVFVNAFFKFTWSIRQYNFCVVLIGAAPQTDRPDEHEDFVEAITTHGEPRGGELQPRSARLLFRACRSYLVLASVAGRGCLGACRLRLVSAGVSFPGTLCIDASEHDQSIGAFAQRGSGETTASPSNRI